MAVPRYCGSSGYGTAAAKYEYYPFGGLLDISGVAAGANPFRFSTKYRDNETGCYYYGYRYLRTKHGRWLNRDPIGERDSANLYKAIDNAPTISIDLIGLQAASQPTSHPACGTLTPERVKLGDLEKEGFTKLEQGADRNSNLFVKCEPVQVADRNNPGVMRGHMRCQYLLGLRFKGKCCGKVVLHADMHTDMLNDKGKWVPVPGDSRQILESYGMKDGVTFPYDKQAEVSQFRENNQYCNTHVVKYCCGNPKSKAKKTQPGMNPFGYDVYESSSDKDMGCCGPVGQFTIKFCYDRAGKYELTSTELGIQEPPRPTTQGARK